jgi:hypothetical protein
MGRYGREGDAEHIRRVKMDLPVRERGLVVLRRLERLLRGDCNMDRRPLARFGMLDVARSRRVVVVRHLGDREPLFVGIREGGMR